MPHLEATARVEARRRLVEEEHGRARDEGGSEVEPAAHASGVGLGRALGGVHEVEALEQRDAAPLRLGAAHAVQTTDHREVLQPGEVLVDRGVLSGETDALAQARGVVHHVEAGHADRARVGLEQRRQHADRRGLAGAVGPQQPEHGAVCGLEVDPVERAHVAEGLHEPGDADRRLLALPVGGGGRAIDGAQPRIMCIRRHVRHRTRGLGQELSLTSGIVVRP
jgi:hypothetical protein